MKNLVFLTVEEVRQIRVLMEALEQSDFDFIQLESRNLKLTMGRGGLAPERGGGASRPIEKAVALPIDRHAGAENEEPATTPTTPAEDLQDSISLPDGFVTITAPIMGLFYSRPDPNAEPFVAIGATIQENDTVGLIEVMKVFNAVQSGATGIVKGIYVEDGQVVEVGQNLFSVEPFETVLEGC